MKGKQEATARDGGGEELGQLTRVFVSCQRTDLTPRQLGLLEGVKQRDTVHLCVREWPCKGENDGLGEGSSGRQAGHQETGGEWGL